MAFVYTYGQTAYTGGPTTNGWAPQTYSYGGKLTFAEAGSVDTLGFYGDCNSGTATVKLALYDTSGNLISGSSASVSGVNSSPGWWDSGAITPVDVSAATYVILSSASVEWVRYHYNTGQAGTYATDAYGSFPSASPSGFTLDGDSGYGYGRRANFTAGASGVTANASITTANATVSGDADVTVTGAAAITGAAATVSSTAAVDVVAQAAITAAAASMSADADALVDANASITTDDATVSSTFTAEFATIGAAADLVADDATVASAGTVDVAGAAAITTEDATQSAAVSVDVVADATITAEDATLAAEYQIGDFISADADITTADATVSAAGVVDVAGSAAITADDAAVSASVGAEVTGAAAITAEGAQVDSTLAVFDGPIDATVAVVADDAVVSATIGEEAPSGGAGGVISKSTKKLFEDYLDERELRRQKRKARVKVTTNDAVVRATAEVIPLEPRIAAAKLKAEEAAMQAAVEVNWSGVIADEDDDFDILFG